MPIYDYRCTACDHLAEIIHGLNDPGPRFCESCGAEGTMRKGVGAPAVLFKGSGWARKEGPGRRESSKERSGDTAGKAGDGGSGETGSDATSSSNAAGPSDA
jgi:putative FmdB family regulatory protein